MPSIPLDVVGVIFDILAYDDENFISLKACSLTCQAFLPLCRKYIFASINIDDRADMLWKLTTTLEIADCVRELHFGIRNGDTWHLIDLPDILKRLTRMSSLTLFYCNAGNLDWKSIPTQMENSLLCLLHLPTLTSLKLCSIENFPISALMLCTHLRHFNK
ncbi:hypothetical protein BDZ97DRAFT_1800857 [Flammula alnicola]|nr:hypothetical protein BDZ97DRAFT_1800857 [Flammula alnicola]